MAPIVTPPKTLNCGTEQLVKQGTDGGQTSALIHRQVHRFVAERRTKPTRSGRKPRQAATLERPTAGPPLPTSRQLARLLVQPISALDALAAAVVAHVEQDPTARAVTQLARRFTALVRASGVGKRTAEGRAAVADLDAWIAEAKACDASAIASFAAGLNGDASAVRAALTEPWSSGPAEGQINRLKLIKRQSYGRAGLDLLRRRMVLAARSTQSEQEPVPRTRGRIPPAHVVMQRLANANASNRLAGALTQLGRLMKTVHILRYIHEAPLRDAFQLQLNRGEFRQILAKSLFFANRGSFRFGDYEEVMNKAS